MTNKELNKKNAELTQKISAMKDQIRVLESDISSFKTRVTKDIQRLVTMVNKRN